MRHHIFPENNVYKTAILIKETSFLKGDLLSNYVHPLAQLRVKAEDMIGFSLSYTEKGTAPVKHCKAYLDSLLKALKTLGTTTLYCADSAYFKVLTKKVAAKHVGYVVPCTIEGYEYMEVVYGVNHTSIFYNPANQVSLDLSLKTLANHLAGSYEEIGLDIIKEGHYVSEQDEANEWLKKLLEYPELTADIETFSLKHYEAGLGTFGFAWDQHSGVVLRCDYRPLEEPVKIEAWCNKDKKYKNKLAHGEYVPNPSMQAAIKEFLVTYEGKLIWHNAGYDIKVLIYVLWMEGDITNHKGLLEGLAVMTRHFDCTKLITYLATNNCAGNKLSLKEIAHEFAGNYGQGEDIKNIRLIPEKDLMEYNLVDCLCTWYAKHKNEPVMIQDEQQELYEGHFKDSITTIIQMELTGMPMCMKEIKKGERELQKIHDHHSNFIRSHPLIGDTVKLMQSRWIERDLSDRRSTAVKPDDIKERCPQDLLKKPPAAYPRLFNPGSGTQLAILLYDIMGLPIIETTATGLPACDGDTLEALVNHVASIPQISKQDVISYRNLIENIRGQLGVDKILTTFIPAFKLAQLGKDGIYYLFGSFNLGGTKSGRLSSSNPNLQNLPSGSTYAKVVKRMFKGNDEWLFSGADYNALTY